MTSISIDPVLSLKGHSDWIQTVHAFDSQNTLVSASSDKTVKLWTPTETQCIRTYPDYDYSLNDIAIVDKNTVITVTPGTIHVMRTTDGHVMAASSTLTDIWSCAALDKTTAVLGHSGGKVSKIAWSQGNIEIVDRKEGEHKDSVYRIFSRGEKFATCSYDNTAKLWDANSLWVIHTFPGHQKWVGCVVFDDDYFVSGADDCTIRVYDIRSTNHLLTIRTHSQQVTFLAIVPETQILVSAGYDGVIALHSLPSGRCTAKYKTGSHIYYCALLDSGKMAVTGICQHDIKIFQIDQLQNVASQVSKPSLIEQAWNTILTDPSKLTFPFIEKTIRAENVLSATALYCGHNIVLLGIRCGVITSDYVCKLNGDLRLLEENLYHPASKFIQESRGISYPIFQHAQDLGIIRDSQKFSFNHENSLHVKAMAGCIEALNKCLTHSGERHQSERPNVVPVIEMNAKNFQFLFDAIKKKEKSGFYAAIAKVNLSLIPLLSELDEGDGYEGPDELLSLSAQDIVELGIGIARYGEWDTTVEDLSNTQLTYCMLSERRMGLMSERARAIIGSAVCASGFESMKCLRTSLKEMIQEGEKHVAKLDMGSSEWLANEAQKRREEETERNRESAIRYQFKSFVMASGKSQLTTEQAAKALNVGLSILGIEKEVSCVEFENLEISEDAFIGVFKSVMANIRAADE